MRRYAPDGADTGALREIVGASRGMQRLRRQVRAVAPLDSTVLLSGETGSGKGRLARALHELSPRAAAPFVHVDCAALSPTLIESELFGHEKGAFTGAAARRIGRFEAAGRGTVFLDEIGDLEPRLQSKLLRVLDDFEFERLGGAQTLPMRARVVAATSRDLRAAVREGHFRPDLYFRLAVFHLPVPPLRERREDIPALVEHGLRRVSRRTGRPPPEAGEGLQARLRQYAWPGNVRELLNVLERLAAQRPAARLEAAHLDGLLEEWPAATQPAAREASDEACAPGLEAALGRVERREILAALEWSGGNVTGAARRLRIPRSTLRHRMRKHALLPGRGPSSGQ
jgi:DNA-binding NtrC family response regulator